MIHTQKFKNKVNIKLNNLKFQYGSKNKNEIKNKRILDFGPGHGLFLIMLKN